MIAVFILLYVVGIWLFYVKMKIKPNPINIAVAATVGVIAIGLIVVLWQFSAPTSGCLVTSRYTIQIVPQVRGPITKIYAKPNEPLIQGKDILFEIQKDTYQYTVNQIEAALQAAINKKAESEAGIQVAEASIKEAQAALESAQAEFAMNQKTAKASPGAVSQLKMTQLAAQQTTAQAALAQSKETKQQTEAAVLTAQSNIESIRAQLETAQFNLKQCTVYAPADGFVTNWQVREGTMAVPLPLAPLGTFVDTSTTAVVASFGQNVAKNIQAGDPVEFAIKSHPGQVFSGKVENVIQASGDGQFVTSGTLISAANIGSSGLYAVKFNLDDEALAKSLAMGTTGMVTVYTKTGSPFHIISKVTVRIKAWMYYLIPF